MGPDDHIATGKGSKTGIGVSPLNGTVPVIANASVDKDNIALSPLGGYQDRSPPLKQIVDRDIGNFVDPTEIIADTQSAGIKKHQPGFTGFGTGRDEAAEGEVFQTRDFDQTTVSNDAGGICPGFAFKKGISIRPDDNLTGVSG